MAEQTNPATGVAQAPPSIEDRLMAVLNPDQATAEQEPEQPQDAQPEQTAQQPADQAASEELTPDDVPDEQAPDAQSRAEEFEIVHDGKSQRLTREETIRLAQQGFDYTQKTQALAAKERQAQELLDTAQQVVQMQAALSDEMAQVKGFERALQPYANVDWVALATNDPLEYPKHRAAYDQLVSGYNAAKSALEQKGQAIMEGQKQATQSVLAKEAQRLRDLIPEWRDEKRFATESQAVADFGLKKGFTQEEMRSVRDARYVAVLRDAWKYNQLLAGKKEKVGQLRTASPMGKPASPSAPTIADKDRELAAAMRKDGGSLQSATARLLNRMK